MDWKLLNNRLNYPIEFCIFDIQFYLSAQWKNVITLCAESMSLKGFQQDTV